MSETNTNSRIASSVQATTDHIAVNAPAEAIGNFYIAPRQALSNISHNSAASQMNTNVMGLTAQSQGISQLLALQNATIALVANRYDP